ncbi:flavin reductase family protein [Rubrivirga sp. S365]|uniref:flavin reductase family protein n=1 Tax=Rubrivirga sp. S365 TaxID=3076080 RepID=UPI0028C59A35|nr:flavin reductase family protein [Rubrivirga sp. S365]MDT7857776.1 flavin reductase family protein [Rubrivirga sp. S365]
MTTPPPAPADQAPEHPEAVEATGEALRSVLRDLPAPVVVVTARTADGPRGATIGSFVSVSLDPPLVSFNVTHGTRLHDALGEIDVWAVHLLSAEQAELAAHFAVPDLDGLKQLAPFPHLNVAPGPPLLRGTLGVLRCRPRAHVEAGDHTVWIAEVTGIVEGAGSAPLLYYRQSYRGVGGEV